ncbi:MAG: hypothetical protein ACI9W2_003069 [Gammaproteobacteria bacterium]|jgi:hypothetical protein
MDMDFRNIPHAGYRVVFQSNAQQRARERVVARFFRERVSKALAVIPVAPNVWLVTRVSMPANFARRNGRWRRNGNGDHYHNDVPVSAAFGRHKRVNFSAYLPFAEL